MIDGVPVDRDAAPLRRRVVHVDQANTVWADDGAMYTADVVLNDGRRDLVEDSSRDPGGAEDV